MEAAYQCGQHMAMFVVVIVVRPVDVGGHYTDEVRAVLTVQELAVLQTGYFGQGVCLVGLFQFAREQATLFHGLGCHAGVDAR